MFVIVWLTQLFSCLNVDDCDTTSHIPEKHYPLP